MMESTTTYTKRENARRAGVAATGVPSERVEVTVHKNGDDVRFGWRVKVVAAKPVVTTVAASDANGAPDIRNGVKRPRSATLCGNVWDWLDAQGDQPVKEVKAAAIQKGWNQNNAAIELYQWRKYHGLNRRNANAA
jgi:hypothetical protein